MTPWLNLPPFRGHLRTDDLAPPSSVPQPAERGLRVLAVDDNLALLAALRRLLRTMGHRVFGASSPAEARALAREHAGRLDLVVSDLVMPEQLGPEMIAQVREEGHCPPAVVYLTGFGASATAMLNDDDIVVQKPCTAEEQTAAIGRARER